MKQVLIILCLSFNILHGSETQETLEHLSTHDRCKIECLFDYFGRLGNLGHVLLFNNKPMCQTGVPLTCTSTVIPPFISKDPLTFQKEIKKCWYTWKRHEDKFSHPNIIICEEVSEVAGGEYLNIYFINKMATQRCLEENEHVFKAVLGNDFTPIDFIAKLKNGAPLSPLIHHDDMLKGILLGFGHQSASAFKHRASHKLVPISGKPKLDKKVGIATVSFMTPDPENAEVKHLQQTYADELAQIASYYEDGSFVKKVLKALCN